MQRRVRSAIVVAASCVTCRNSSSSHVPVSAWKLSTTHPVSFDYERLGLKVKKLFRQKALSDLGKMGLQVAMIILIARSRQMRPEMPVLKSFGQAF